MKYSALVLLVANISLLQAILIKGQEGEEGVVSGTTDDMSDVEKNQIKHKFDEVNNLMSKYENAEKKAKWFSSAEYKKQKEQKKIEAAREARQKKMDEAMEKVNQELLKKTKEEEET